ncbi:MAG: hypothetical protein AAGH81_15425 [Bacteroidota bacterium]
MKKILAFEANNSAKSINKELAMFTANQLKHIVMTIADLNDHARPRFKDGQIVEPILSD